MVYIYRSPIGPIAIRYDQGLKKFALMINDVCCGHYESAIAAADDVYMHVTGCYDWDKLDGKVDAPTDLSEWEFR